jgi:hypothetical protein
MARYIATVEYADGQYWISFPGIQKAGSPAKLPEDIIPHAQAFLTDRVYYGSPPAASLDDAITDPSEPFEGVNLVVFEWEPPPRTGYRVVGYEDEELVLEIQVPGERVEAARALLALHGQRPLTKEDVNEIGVTVLPGGGFSYFLEADGGSC